MTMITPSYLGETIEYSSLHACRSTLEDPTFMIYFLIVVTVGGTSGIMGPFLASLLLGVADVAGKYYLSSALGGFVIYVVLIVVLVVRPNGLFARAR